MNYMCWNPETFFQRRMKMSLYDMGIYRVNQNTAPSTLFTGVDYGNKFYLCLMDSSIVKIISTYLSKKPVKRGFIFGSTAIGQNSSKSDLDILLEIDDDARVSLLDFIGWKFDLEKLTEKKSGSSR